MADTTSLQSVQPRETKNTLTKVIGGTFEELTGDIFDSITGVNRTPDSFEAREPTVTPVPEYVKKAFTSGSIENFNQARPKSEESLIAEQRAAVAEAESILRRARTEFIIQEEVRYEVAGMPEADRNKRLRLNTSLRRKHTEDAYHIAELYRQVKAEITAIELQRANTEIPSPAKQPSAMEGAFEGRSGSQGGGTANLSAQAVG